MFPWFGLDKKRGASVPVGMYLQGNRILHLFHVGYRLKPQGIWWLCEGWGVGVVKSMDLLIKPLLTNTIVYQF